ncbi:hypothetical protein GGD38_002503 [Chitinophagaceae bacterium OAS944]|nr:hypothetical protein [Chitinophagaceae bacterium OAS944]
MTRTTAGTRPAHHFGQAQRKLQNTPKATFRHTLPPPFLTHGLTHTFDSSQSAEMSVLTIVTASFKENFFVHFSSHFTATHYRVSNQAQLLTHAGYSAYSLNHDSITFKIAIL